ncbi:hypothetical protein SKTS_09300 [Sulfurimicrobium lacus]|uniref:Uncharacterized protein n=1 Tax=Sulfurimicrobium lacus TaxID=2715678 RepID=A0A6F8V8Q7_9PROT|nr:hypothetical protein [Sulfurimicrobium lacus]BCB26044.1 hypothetical protein SKTS_09300 [Sulfurimicrobium lacus]
MNAAIETLVFAPRASDRCPLCALVGALAAALALAILAKTLFLVPRGPTLLALDETCSISSETCSMPLPGGGRLEFALGPRPVRLLSPLKLEIRVSGSNARALEVDFTGVNTPMAFNRAYLIPSGNGVYGAQTGLPVCATGRMVWQATVLLENGERQMLAPFRFETEH